MNSERRTKTWARLCIRAIPINQPSGLTVDERPTADYTGSPLRQSFKGIENSPSVNASRLVRLA
jgi:hypothetical protein